MKQSLELQQRRFETELTNLKAKQEQIAAAAVAAAEKKSSATASATATARSYTKEVSVYGNDRLVTNESTLVPFV